MIRLGSTIKVTHTSQYHDPQLALQTAAAYFIIREIPTSTIPTFSTQTPLINDPSNDQNSLNNGNNGLPKSVLEYIFLALVAFLIVCIVLRKYRIVRLRQQQAAFLSSASRRYHNSPRRPVELRSLHPDGQPYPAYPDPYLREIPAAYMGLPPSRRTRARDIDPSGRRQDIPTEMDHDGDLGTNDALPAYDNFGGPPKYYELDMPSRNRPPLTHRPDVSWENINTPVDTTHAAQVSQPDTSRPIPPCLENSSSNDSVPMTRPRHENYRD